MAKEQAEKQEQQAPQEQLAPQVDDFAQDMFEGMGFEAPLSESTVNLYKAYKRYKDKLNPGRVTPEGFAFVAVLADMADGRLVLGKAGGD